MATAILTRLLCSESVNNPDNVLIYADDQMLGKGSIELKHGEKADLSFSVEFSRGVTIALYQAKLLTTPTVSQEIPEELLAKGVIKETREGSKTLRLESGSKDGTASYTLNYMLNAVEQQQKKNWFKLTKIQCVKKHDGSGKDEPYIQLDGKTIWGGQDKEFQIKEGQTRTILMDPIQVDATEKLALYEYDWGTKDEKIGESLTINVPELVGHGEQNKTFQIVHKGKVKTHYVVSFTVRRE